MILGSKNNSFRVTFPKNFLYPQIEEKYSKFIKKLNSPYESTIDYLNSSIQQITFPGANTETVRQTLHEDPVQWKAGYRMGIEFEREFDITFKNYEGYLNYWIMFEQLREYLDYDQKDEFMPNMSIQFLDYSGYEFVSLEYKQIIMRSITELDLNYSSNTPEFQTFSCGFSFNYFELKQRLEKN